MQIGKYLENILEKYVKIMTDAKEGNLWCQINFRPQSFYQSEKMWKDNHAHLISYISQHKGYLRN